MKRFEELPTADAETILRVAANRENVSLTRINAALDAKTSKRIALQATFSATSIGSDGNTVEIPFAMDLTTVSEFIQKFPVACFNAKCQMR